MQTNDMEAILQDVASAEVGALILPGSPGKADGTASRYKLPAIPEGTQLPAAAAGGSSWQVKKDRAWQQLKVDRAKALVSRAADMPKSVNVTIPGIANAWEKFQEVCSSLGRRTLLTCQSLHHGADAARGSSRPAA